MPVYNEENKNKWTRDGRHYYYKCYYTDFEGNRKQKVSKMYKLSSEAKEAERAFLNQVLTKDLTDYNITFEFVYNEWLEFKKRLIKSTTYYSLEKMMNKHVAQYLNSYKLHYIKYNTIQDVLNKETLTICNQRYQNKVIGYLKELFTYAKDNYDYDNKIVNRIQKQRIETVDRIKNSQWNFWTLEEFNVFISFVDNQLYSTLFTFLYFTGARLGEALALNWNDIDFKKKTLNINKNLTNKIGGNCHKLVDPKTTNSIRIIDLDDNLVNVLEAYKEEESKLYDFSNDMFVFGNVKPLNSTTVSRYLNYYIQLSNVKKITPHGFRHSHVSLLINLGCDFIDVAARVGDTVQVIQDTYFHMFPEKKSQPVKFLNNIINK